MTRDPDDKLDLEALFGCLCNEALTPNGREQLNDELTNNPELQEKYVLYADLHAAIRQHAESWGDENFALREAQTAIDTVQSACESAAAPANELSRRSIDSAAEKNLHGAFAAWPRRIVSSCRRSPIAGFSLLALLMLSLGLLQWYSASDDGATDLAGRTSPGSNGGLSEELGPAHLSGAVGARWAGEQLEILEGTQFAAGQRLELIEGLAELCFQSGTRVILQGPAILQVQDDTSVFVSVGRIATTIPESASTFTLQSTHATFTSKTAQYGVEVDVDESLLTQVYSGVLELALSDDDSPTPRIELGEGQGVSIDASSGRLKQLDEANQLHFVRYLPKHEALISLADIVAGGNGLADATRQEYHQGISLTDGKPVESYGAIAYGDGQYRKVEDLPLVDGVFIPNGHRGAIQVDSIGRTFAGFPPTTDDCWGSAIMTRRPSLERSLPSIRLEYHGDNYGYVNWLHIASNPEELVPLGYGIIGMHSNSGITFDLHAIRALHPNKKILRFRARVGNLESKREADASHAADAWVLVDGELRYSRKAFNREQEPEVVVVPLTDHDRFLVLAVTDSGKDAAYDWVGFGDPLIETTSRFSEASALTNTRKLDDSHMCAFARCDSGGRNQQFVPGASESFFSTRLISQQSVRFLGKRLLGSLTENSSSTFLLAATYVVSSPCLPCVLQPEQGGLGSLLTCNNALDKQVFRER